MASLLSRRKPIQHTIDFGDAEETLDFYPVSLRFLGSMKNLVKDIAKAVNAIMTDSKTYAGFEQNQSGQEGAVFQINTKVGAMPLEMAQHLEKRKQEGIEMLLELVTDPKKLETICGLIADSLRDDQPKYSPGEIMNGDAYMVVQLAMGVFKVNMELFHPLMGGLAMLTPSAAQDQKDEKEGNLIPMHRPN